MQTNLVYRRKILFGLKSAIIAYLQFEFDENC